MESNFSHIYCGLLKVSFWPILYSYFKLTSYLSLSLVPTSFEHFSPSAEQHNISYPRTPLHAKREIFLTKTPSKLWILSKILVVILRSYALDRDQRTWRGNVWGIGRGGGSSRLRMKPGISSGRAGRRRRQRRRKTKGKKKRRTRTRV